MSDHKTCPFCFTGFERPKNYSVKQWEKRVFCSHACSSRKGSLGRNDEIIKLYKTGMSCSQISEEIPLTKEHIARIVKKAGETRTPSNRVSMALNRPEVIEKMSTARKGVPLSEAAKNKLRTFTGSKRYNWRNGITMSSGGYLQFTSSTENGVHRNRLMHQVIAEWKIGRKLAENEHVHHIDRNKLNNDPSNLQILTDSEHAILHNQDRMEGLKKWHHSIAQS